MSSDFGADIFDDDVPDEAPPARNKIRSRKKKSPTAGEDDGTPGAEPGAAPDPVQEPVDAEAPVVADSAPAGDSAQARKKPAKRKTARKKKTAAKAEATPPPAPALPESGPEIPAGEEPAFMEDPGPAFAADDERTATAPEPIGVAWDEDLEGEAAEPVLEEHDRAAPGDRDEEDGGERTGRRRRRRRRRGRGSADDFDEGILDTEPPPSAPRPRRGPRRDALRQPLARAAPAVSAQRIAILLHLDSLLSGYGERDDEIAFSKLLRSVADSRDLIRAVAYGGREAMDRFEVMLRQCGFETVTVDDSATLGVAVAVDAMAISSRVDCVVLVPALTTLAPLATTLRGTGVRVESAGFDAGDGSELDRQHHHVLGEECLFRP